MPAACGRDAKNAASPRRRTSAIGRTEAQAAFQQSRSRRADEIHPAALLTPSIRSHANSRLSSFRKRQSAPSAMTAVGSDFSCPSSRSQ